MKLLVRPRTLGVALAIVLLSAAPAAHGAVTAQVVRIDNPTGFTMEWRQVEVFVGGVNVLLDHPELVRGTVPTRPGNTAPTKANTVLTGEREAREITNGDTDTSRRASEWRAFTDPYDNTLHLNPWIEIDLGRPLPIERIVLHASRHPSRFHLDKGHRVVSALDATRTVVWAAKWQYYDVKAFPAGVFAFTPVAQAAAEVPVVGTRLAVDAPDWVGMAWLLDADASRPPADAEARLRRFAGRNAPGEVERLARTVFPLLDTARPDLAEAGRLFAAGQHQAALDAWKRAWFVKMAKANLHVALHADYVSYAANGADLLAGVMVTITPHQARAIRYTPGQITWIDLPDKPEGRELQAALDDCERKAQVGKVSWPLLYAYRQDPQARYLQRWAEIMDDWSLNFFADAAQTPYEVENLFTFNPAHCWGTMMEDLADIAAERPELIELIPSTTLARVQLLCLEKYSSAWWRQTRETVFNHVTGGLYSWGLILPYIDDFHPGQRAAREFRQGLERFITLGTEPDGALTEIGDEGHMEIPTILGYTFAMLEKSRPAWYTPGWRNRSLEWYDAMFAYMFRHLSPGGYEHRFAVDYRPQRWLSTSRQYWTDRKVFRPIDRDAVFFAIPEVRRLLGAWAQVARGGPASSDPLLAPIVAAQQRAAAPVVTLLGGEKPGAPRILSDWMPYTGASYFRGGWAPEDPFLAMMACGSHGGSQAPQWPYGMFYHYDHHHPLLAAQPMQVDGLPPQQLFGRMHCFQPGTKTMALTQAQEKPLAHRWLSDERFAFGEARFHGGYQKFPGFAGRFAEEKLVLGPAVADVRSLRQVLQLRGSRLFIVSDAIAADDGMPHRFSVPYEVSLAQRKDAATPFGPRQLQIDAANCRLRSDNPGSPSVTLFQFADQPLRYVRGAEAKPDNRAYGKRLGPDIAIADQPVAVEATAPSLSLVSLIASRAAGDPERVTAIAALPATPGSVGFHATLATGGEIWYRSAGLGEAALACGPASATGQVLLVVRDADGLSGILLGGSGLVLSGKAVALTGPDAAFVLAAKAPAVATTAIHTPIDPVSFRPQRTAFAEAETVEMVSATPGVEIRYTTDGTPPTRASRLYTGPLTITGTTEFAARAWRLGADGKPLPADGFTIDGTRFTVPSYGTFTKRAPLPAMPLRAADLRQGLAYERLDAPWWRLYASAHWLPAAATGTVEREMDLGPVGGDDCYGVRYKGYLDVPTAGTWTLHAPRELVNMDGATSYDLRVYIDGEEWYLGQWWHGRGTWSIPLAAGVHAFQVDFADARSTPWRRSGIWRYYPKPWAVRQGPPTDILLSGPGVEPARIPKEWLLRAP